MTRGVYSALPSPWSVEARWTGGVLAGGEGALLGGDSWLEAFGVNVPRPLAPVEVIIGAGRERTSSLFAIYERSRALDPMPVSERSRLLRPLARDVGIASARSVVVRLGADYAESELRGVLATLTQRKLTTPSDVIAWASAHRRLPGAQLALKVATELLNGAESEGEFHFLETTRLVGLPPDEGHVNIYLRSELLSVTDAWWDEGVPGYFDGSLHDRWASRQLDNRARTLMANAGLRPFEVTTMLRDDIGLFGASLRARIREAGEARVKTWRRVPGGIELAGRPDVAA